MTQQSVQYAAQGTEGGGAALARESAQDIECYQEIVHDCICSD